MKSRVVHSKFNQNEEFDVSNVPKHFRSVTDSSIRKIRSGCLHSISAKYHGEYKAGAIQAMLESIDGSFEGAYAQLDGDYQTRKSNLLDAYDTGVADLSDQLDRFDLLVNNYNAQYEEYAEAVKEFTGRAPSEKLRFSDQRLERYHEQAKNLRSKADEQ